MHEEDWVDCDTLLWVIDGARKAPEVVVACSCTKQYFDIRRLMSMKFVHEAKRIVSSSLLSPRQSPPPVPSTHISCPECRPIESLDLFVDSLLTVSSPIPRPSESCTILLSWKHLELGFCMAYLTGVSEAPSLAPQLPAYPKHPLSSQLLRTDFLIPFRCISQSGALPP